MVLLVHQHGTREIAESVCFKFFGETAEFCCEGSLMFFFAEQGIEAWSAGTCGVCPCLFRGIESDGCLSKSFRLIGDTPRPVKSVAHTFCSGCSCHRGSAAGHCF